MSGKQNTQQTKAPNKTWKLLAPIVVLCAICLVITAALALANQVTAPVIAAAEQAKADAALVEVLPEANGSTFTDLTGIELPAGITAAKQADNGAGYVFSVTTKGFGGDINLMVGLSAQGAITGSKVITHAETQGIGSKVVEDGSPFQQQLIGMTDTSGIVATSGASVSSKGMTDAMKAAFDAYTLANGGTVEIEYADRPASFTDEVVAQFYADPAYTEVPGGMILSEGTVVYASEFGMESDVGVAVCFDANGAILGISVDASHETEGLGTRCGESEFTDLFKGVSSADEVDALSGATVTSTAVKTAVNAAIANYETVKGAA